MSFDKLDKKVQEAADQHSPAYSEDSWLKMEALLNEHMPQDKEVKRKRPLTLIFILLLLIGGGVTTFVMQPWNNGKKDNEAKNIQKASPAAIENKNTNSNTNSKPKSKSNLNSNNIAAVAANKNPRQKDLVPPNNSLTQTLISKNAVNKSFTSNSPVASWALHPKIDGAGDAQLADKTNTVTTESNNNASLINPDFEHQTINDISLDKEILANNISVNKSLEQNKTSNLTANKTPRGKTKSKFNNLFSLNFSAGPDVSAVDVNNIGTVKLLYGAGIGYNFGKRWQVKTGVFAVKKVYDAMPSDYHPPVNFWNYYPNLDEVSANCNVLEVPVVLNYIFSQQSRQAWFVSAGLSSYFMKKETYNYHSKIAPNLYQDKIYTIKNQNEHYLSSLRLSAGYEKKLNKTISLSAEPYVNLPLSGVGYGKVKLSSAGLLFSLSLKPFAKNN
ncbi:MAG: hypothetical protein ABI594_02755 [Ginsengibacter sp.]